MSVARACAANVVIAVGIVVSNKTLLQFFDLPIIATLFVNFVFVAVAFRLTRGPIAVKDWQWSLAIVGVFAVVSNNAAAQSNTLGVYQINKLLLFPLLLLLEPLMGVQQFYNRTCYLALVGVSSGVFVVFYGDLKLTWRGGVLGTVSNVLTAYYQTRLKRDQTKELRGAAMFHAMIGPQLLAVGTLSAVFDILSPSLKSILLLPAADLLAYSWTSAAVCVLGVNCILALLQQVSNLGLLSDVGPVTFQVLGSVKSIVIVLLGLAFFDPEMEGAALAQRLGGSVLALGSAGVYAVSKPSGSAVSTSTTVSVSAKTSYQKRTALPTTTKTTSGKRTAKIA
jgi:solute carrier family 35 protein E3